MTSPMMTSAASAARKQAEREDRERSFELNAKQYDFVYDDDHKYCAYIGGIGGGKSFAGAVKALRKAVELPGSLGLVGAPTYPMLRDATLRSVLDIFPPAFIVSFNKSEMLASCANGSEILFRSTDDSDKLRGPNLAWFWLDEGPLCGHYAWKVMKGRLRQAGFTAPDVTQGWITGSPKGEDEFYEDFEAEPKPGHQLYRASTRENAHNLPPTFIEDLGYTGKFAQQEIEGLFVTFDGLVYEFRSDWHLGEWQGGADSANPGVERRPRLKIGGVDWGTTNPAVALPMWVDYDDRVFVRDEYYERGAGFLGNAPTVGEGGLSKAVLDFTREYGIETWYCGPDEPGHITALNAMFGRHGVRARAVAANDDIIEGITTVRQYMAPRRDGTTGFKLSARCAQTRAEFRTYCWPSAAEGKRDPQEKPVKRFDHAMDGGRYAIHSALGLLNKHRSLPTEGLLEHGPRVSEIGGIRIYKKTF